MSWQFWKKAENKQEKLSKPKEIPETVGRHLVVNMHKDADWVWNLKCVIKKHQANAKTVFDFRVFDEEDAASKTLRIKNYTTLDEHPDLILFEGWFDKRTAQVHVEEVEKAPAQFEPQFKKAS